MVTRWNGTEARREEKERRRTEYKRVETEKNGAEMLWIRTDWHATEME